MRKDKTIAFFTENFGLLGGTERSSIQIANQLAGKRYKVFLFSFKGDVSKPGFEIHEKVTWCSLNIPVETSLLSRYRFVCCAIRHFIKENRVDIIVSVEVMVSWFTVPALIGLGSNVTHVVWEHFNYQATLGLRSRAFARILAGRFADHIVVLTDNDKKTWLANHPNASVVRIYNPSPYGLPAYQYKKDSKVVIAVGRYTYQKGYDTLIKVWASIKEQLNGWELRIIGSGEDEEVMRSLIESEGVVESVMLMPNTKNVADHYSAASFLCLSSRFEGLPMVLIEAQSFGLPIVAFDCITGPSDIVQPGMGILSEDGSIEALADGILKMIESSEMRIAMSAKAREGATRFLAVKILSEWELLFGEGDFVRV